MGKKEDAGKKTRIHKTMEIHTTKATNDGSNGFVRSLVDREDRVEWRREDPVLFPQACAPLSPLFISSDPVVFNRQKQGAEDRDKGGGADESSHE